MTGADLWSVAPESVLAVAGIVILLLDAFAPALRRAFTGLAVVAVGHAGWAAVAVVPDGPSFNGLLDADGVTLAFSLVVLVATLLALLASQGYLRREGILAGEYHALMLWCATGLLLMLRATELLTVFVALETLSLCLYALAAFNRRVGVGSEAAIKYFLMGAFASAFVLYGIALLYGETGSTRFDGIAIALRGRQRLGLPRRPRRSHAGRRLRLQDEPGAVPRLVARHLPGGAVAVRRLPLGGAEGGERAGADPRARDRWPALSGFHWSRLVALLAVLSMVVGNLLALVQKDIKRMLAYSGIAHMGYLLIALASLNRDSYGPVLVYLLAYALMNAGAFAVVALLYARAGEHHLISELSGWGYRFPLLGACLTVCMLSLGGIPPTAGFIGKYLIFVHAVENGQIWLAVVGVATSLLGVFYYLRVVYTLYMRPEQRSPEGLAIDLWGRGAALLAAAGTLALGIWPGRLIAWMSAAVSGLGR